jgi:hypothetical protein
LQLKEKIKIIVRGGKITKLQIIVIKLHCMGVFLNEYKQFCATWHTIKKQWTKEKQMGLG